MAFNNLGRYGIDSSDVRAWAGSPTTKAFIDEILEQKDLAFNKLLKGGEKNHSQNSESYKAFEKVLRLIEWASKMK